MIRIINSPEIRRTLDPIIRPVVIKTNNTTRRVVVPGMTTYN